MMDKTTIMIKNITKCVKSLFFYFTRNNSIKKFVREFEKGKNTILVIDDYTNNHRHIEIFKDRIISFDYSSPENEVYIEYLSKERTNTIYNINANCILNINIV